MAIQQGKTFIIAGSIGLLISLYFLVKTIIGVAQPSLSNDEQIQDKNPTTLQTGQVDKPSDSLQAQTGEILQNKELKIIIPLQLRNTGFDDLAQTISGIDIRYDTITGIQHYNSLLSGGRDLAIIPSDILLSFQPYTQSLQTSEDLGPYFHANIGTTQQGNTFIPFAIDPRVTYIQASTTPPNGGISRNNLLSFVVLRKQSRSSSIALGRGINENDIKNTLKNNHIYPEYPYFTQSVIQGLIQDNDIASRNKFIDFINNTKDRKGQRIQQILQVLNERNDICKDFAQTCLGYYNFVDMWFDTRSSLSIWKNFFEAKESPKIAHVPYQSSYPARVRGFMIASGADITQSAIYLQAYMQNSITNDIILHSDTIPAHNQTRQGLFLRNEWKVLKTVQQKITATIGTIEGLEQTFRTTPLINVLQGNITPTNFLQKITDG